MKTSNWPYAKAFANVIVAGIARANDLKFTRMGVMYR